MLALLVPGVGMGGGTATVLVASATFDVIGGTRSTIFNTEDGTRSTTFNVIGGTRSTIFSPDSGSKDL